MMIVLSDASSSVLLLFVADFRFQPGPNRKSVTHVHARGRIFQFKSILLPAIGARKLWRETSLAEQPQTRIPLFSLLLHIFVWTYSRINISTESHDITATFQPYKGMIVR
jgi:hypothetical protein